MSSIASSQLNSSVTGYATTAFGAGSQIYRSLKEKVVNVSFMRGDATLVSFDAVVQETHAIEAQPTAMPIEDGSTISDHVIRTPRELNIQAIITDTPLRDKTLLAQEAIASVAGVVGGPLGVFALSQAQSFASSQALAEAASPSIANFRQIVALATGLDGQPPLPFTVSTAIADYPNMMIRSVQVPRDVTTGAALVFGITLTSMTIVSSVTVAASVTSVGQQNIRRIKKGAKQVSQVGLAYKEGNNFSDATVGKTIRFQDAPSVYTGQ